MARHLLVLANDTIRARALSWIKQAPEGTRVEFAAAKRTDEQNARLWAMLADVAKQCRHHGIKLSSDDWKLLFMDALGREMRMVPNLEGTGMVALGRSSSRLCKADFSDLIELIFAFGAREGVRWSDPTIDSSQGPGGAKNAPRLAA